MNYRLSGSSVHGIYQSRILDWVAISLSRGSSWPRDQTCISRVSCTGRWILYCWATREAYLMSVFVVHSLSHVQLFAIPRTAAYRASLTITIISLVCSNSCPLSWWCHRTISSSFTPFSSCLQSFPASGSFPVSRLFTSGGQSIEASALASLLPMNIQGRFPLGLTGLISLLSKGLSRVFCN